MQHASLTNTVPGGIFWNISPLEFENALSSVVAEAVGHGVYARIAEMVSESSTLAMSVDVGVLPRAGEDIYRPMPGVRALSDQRLCGLFTDVFNGLGQNHVRVVIGSRRSDAGSYPKESTRRPDRLRICVHSEHA